MRRVRFVSGDCVRPGAGTADGPAHPHPLQDGDELRAVRCLVRGQEERQRAAPPIAGDVNFAGLSAPGASEEGGLQPKVVPAPDVSSFIPLSIVFDPLPGLFVAIAPFTLAFSASVAAFLRHCRKRLWAVVGGRPGAELRRHLPPLPARPEPPDHTLELLPQPLGVRAVLTDRQVRLDELPLRIRELSSRHPRTSIGLGPAAKANLAD